MNKPSQFTILIDRAGNLLSATNASLGSCPLADDTCMWLDGKSGLSSADGSVTLSAAESADYLRHPGPRQLPSSHVADLLEKGYTVVEGILDEAELSRLKLAIAAQRAAHHADETPHDGHFWMMRSLLWSPDAVRAAVNPVALWIMQAFMQTPDLHFCHQPIITTVKPADKLVGTYPEQGWHSDYPYHPGVFPNEHWPASPVFGVQYNVCVDAFRADNAATQFLPGSHKLCQRPPNEFNLGGTRMGVGQHRDVAQLRAPAGAALIYDSRVWHRACPELNLSGEDRVACLNAVAPAWVQPMIDKTPLAEQFADSPVPAQLTDRELADVLRMCNSPTQPVPADAPKLQHRRKPPVKR